MFLITLIIICVLAYWTQYRIANRNNFKLIENFVCFANQRPYPIIGHLPIFAWKSTNDKIKIFCSETLKTDRTAKLWIFSKLSIILNTPQDVQTVLQSPNCLQKGSLYKILTGTGSGLITAPPVTWKAHRRFFNTPFIFQNIVTKIPKINQISSELVQDLMQYCGRGEISLIDTIGYRLMDITLSVLFDYSYNKTTLLRCFHVIEESMAIIANRLIKFYIMVVVVFFENLLRIVPRDRILLYGLVEMLAAGFIADKEKCMQEIVEDAQLITTVEELRTRPDGFLKRLYRMKFHGLLTDAELEENFGQFLVAGADTSSTAVGNIILCLATYPHVQDKLYDELKSIMDDSDELDWDTITRLEYLNRVIKECLRFLPIVPIVVRQADANIQLEDGIVPAGTDIVIPISSLHRSECIWGPNVNQFNPDNFLPENCHKRHRCSFIPFSYGPRNCIGYKYAMISMRILIANLVKNFRFTTNLKLDELNFEFGISMKPTNGYRVILSKRN